MTEILIKRLSKNINLPKYETNGSTGMDLAANIEEKIEIKPGKSKIIPTGLRLAFLRILRFKLDQGPVLPQKIRLVY